MNRNARLPEEIVEEARMMLSHVPMVYVIRWNGRYRVVESLRGYFHAADEAVVAELRDYDFYTDDERTANYINEHHQYPEWYMGRRDKDILSRLDEDVEYDPAAHALSFPVGRIVNGDFVLDGGRRVVSEG